MSKTEWDYSTLAAFYDNRADYADSGIDFVISAMELAPGTLVADVGAGTGKLSRPLAARGLTVEAVEPNDEMRKHGIRNTSELPVRWRDGTAEHTGLDDHAARAVFFGSSFNVVDQVAALGECRRIVAPKGWFCCMWNHRDLDDPIQAGIEATVRSFIPGYTYGSRREDPTDILARSGLFAQIIPHASRFTTAMTRQTVMDAWRSHGTLARQAGDRFGDVVAAIDAQLPGESIEIPYTTRLWFARFAQ